MNPITQLSLLNSIAKRHRAVSTCVAAGRLLTVRTVIRLSYAGGGITPKRYHPARRACIGSLPYSEVATPLVEVRLAGHSGLESLALSASHVDPQPHSVTVRNDTIAASRCGPLSNVTCWPVCDIERRANSASAHGRIRRSIITALSPPCRADVRRGSKSQRPALQSCSSRVRSRQHDRHSTVATARGGFSCVATLSPRSRSCYGEPG
jgi:hypothetical protein